MSTQRSGPWRRAAAIGAVLLLALAGCSDDDSDADDLGEDIEASESPFPAPGSFADKVNRLCDQLSADSLDVTGGEDPTREQFLEDEPKLAALVEKFDAEVAKLPVTEADRAAAAAMKAFQRYSDESYAKVVEAAKTGDDAAFSAAFTAFLEGFEDTDADENIQAEGIFCPGR
ncbi:hypothetical protein GCM10009547_46370 [Sporichthya brevicatena]|uniref:Lipoprotein n=1 Tax=Sporichthya brevicatena TaxID=171442 RepID=A0ABP3SI12_9ACTN